MFYASLSQRHRNQQLCGLELAKALQHPKAHQLIWASMALSWWTSRTPACQTAWHRAALGCGLRTAVGKNHRGKPFCCLAKQKKALEILSGGQVLAELAVAISGVVGMVSSPLWWLQCSQVPELEGAARILSQAAGAGSLTLWGFSLSSALHLSLSLPWQRRLGSVLPCSI